MKLVKIVEQDPNVKDISAINFEVRNAILWASKKYDATTCSCSQCSDKNKIIIDGMFFGPTRIYVKEA